VKKRKAKPLTLGNFFRLRLKQVEAEFKKAINQKSKTLPKDPASLLYFQANGRLHDLFQLTKKGDREAAGYLLSVLTDNVELFLNLCSKNPKLAREIRFPGVPWPLLHTQLEVNQEGYLTVPRNHVLRKLGIIRKGRTFSEEAVGTRVAMRLYREMDFYRRIGPQQPDSTVLGSIARDATHAKQIKRIRSLQPLRLSNYADWCEAAQPLFLYWWGGEFQDHADFRNWRAEHYEKQTEGKLRGIKRRDINKALQRGFKSLATSLDEKHVPHSPRVEGSSEKKKKL
jgi:hypothetical protein